MWGQPASECLLRPIAYRGNTCNLDGDPISLNSQTRLQATEVSPPARASIYNRKQGSNWSKWSVRFPGSEAQTMMICLMKMNLPQRMY